MCIVFWFCRAEDINEVVTENMRNKKVSFSLPDDSETEDVMDMQLERGMDLNETKSSFEKRQEKVFILFF